MTVALQPSVRLVPAATCLLALLAHPAPAAADETAEAVLPPAYQFLRFNEDWSVMADERMERTDVWDPVKHVPLTDDGSVWASFGGHMRLRVEDFRNFNFGGPSPDDDTYALWRMTLHADVHAGDAIRAFIEGKSAQSTDRDLPGGRRILEADSLDLEQAFVDVTLPLGDGSSLTIRPGRQTLSFGKQRLVSPLPWANTLRRWDGVSLILTCPDWKAHGFLTHFVPVEKHEFNDHDEGVDFFGVYATGPAPCLGLGLDLYYLGLDRRMAAFNGTAGREERHTVGGRLFGPIGGGAFDLDFEGAYQFGEVGAGDVSAFMIGTQLGFTPPGQDAVRLHVGLDFGSGDRSAGGDVETFNQLFPLGHAYYGYIDAVGRQNALDLSAGATAKLSPKVTLAVTGHLFRRDDGSDALYNAGGGVLPTTAPSRDLDVGSEIDLTLTYKVDRHLTAQFGYSHFFPGDFVEDATPGEDIDFTYLQLQYTF